MKEIEQVNRYMLITNPEDPDYKVKKYMSNGKEVTLYRIRALMDIGDIPSGTVGGYIENENNLSRSTYDTAWIDESCVVAGGARIESHARIKNKSIISNEAVIGGKCTVDDCNISKAVIKGEFDLEDVNIDCPVHIQYGSGSLAHCVVVLKGDAIKLSPKQIWYQDPDGRNVEFTSMRDNTRS